ncbi:hypothetical protein B0H17DRAFT_1173626 [Mycena rosella]|uniref:Uncharacterized protein n=1 Tax=Mycena rosella TaxID=1033263 RepID=A0AAD7H375_MYCRO|nr:hypothetical protein B0H17DRAFT_1173626 [Mycena rosella]
MLVRSRKQTPVFIVIPFHTTSGSSRVQSRTILAPSWNWHSALGFSLGLSRTTLAPPWSWHSALGFGFAVESDNASPILELAFGTRSSISRNHVHVDEMSLLAFSLFLPQNLAGFNDFMTRLLASKLTGHEDSRVLFCPHSNAYQAFPINSCPTKHHDLAHNPSRGKPPKYDKTNHRMADQGQALQDSAVYLISSGDSSHLCSIKATNQINNAGGTW